MTNLFLDVRLFIAEVCVVYLRIVSSILLKLLAPKMYNYSTEFGTQEYILRAKTNRI